MTIKRLHELDDCPVLVFIHCIIAYTCLCAGIVIRKHTHLRYLSALLFMQSPKFLKYPQGPLSNINYH